MDPGLAPILFLLVVLVTAVRSQIQSGPANALIKVGDSVTLKCVTNNKNCDGVEWKKMEGAQSPKTVFRDGTIFNGFKERYSVSGTAGCNLTITQLQIGDSGKFSCVLTVEASEVTRGSTLVVIDVTESCQPLTSINEMTEGDSYNFSTAVNVPAKSVEPSNVTLSFLNLATDETETIDDKQPPTAVKKTLTGTMSNADVTPHECRASFTPTPVINFDNNPASLILCTTQQVIRSHPTEDVAVSSSGPYYKGTTVRCTAKGYPYPTFKWTHLKSEAVVNNDTLFINGEPEDKYTCTATNTVKGKVTSLSVTIEVSSDPVCGAGCIAPICVVVAIIIILVVLLACYKFNWCPFHAKFQSIMGKKSSDINGESTNIPMLKNPPEKPPRASDTPVPANV